jgi:V/A-type H+-transporting ATPase subunit I
MAISKMNLIHTIAYKDDIDKILRDLVIMGNLEFVDAYKEFDEAFLDLHIQEGREKELVSIHQLTPYKTSKDQQDVLDELKFIIEKLGLKIKVNKGLMTGDYKFDMTKESVDSMYILVKEIIEEIDQIEVNLRRLEEISCSKCLEDIDVDFRMLMELDFFTSKWGHLTKENSKKLNKNYENIPALILHMGEKNSEEIYIAIYPKSFETETDKILKSLDFQEIQVDKEFLGHPHDMDEMIAQKKIEHSLRIDELKLLAREYLEDNLKMIEINYSRIVMEKHINEIKNKMLSTTNFVYFSAWISQDDNSDLEDYLKTYDTRVYYEFTPISRNSIYLDIPTKMTNNWIFKPFETLVKMYGVPSYNEIDPTTYFGLIYMLLFGLMFGDFGQGMVFVVAGYIIKKYKHNLNGAILERLGLSSMLFGTFYDSFFGYEHVISHYFPWLPYIRPIENINLILGGSVVLGIIMLSSSYVYSIRNKLKSFDYEEGIFGRNGIIGFILFLSIVFFAGTMFISINPLISDILLIMIIGLGLMIFLKEPLYRYFYKKKPMFKNGAKEYFIESIFEIFETFLSIFSNSLSFIRVGAFALNHVGLSVAFHTLAALINTGWGNVLLFFIGNLLVIFLEGLIVFIQGLRLVFYELFSKYYTGEGREFAPTKLQEE